MKAAVKTRTRMDPLDRKQELVEASIDVLAVRGYAGFTLAEVAEVAGVSTALIIVHFKSKELLLLEALKFLGQSYFGALHASQFGTRGRAADLLWSLVEADFAEGLFTPRYLAAWKSFWTETNARRSYVDIFGAQSRHFTELTVKLCHRIIEEGRYAGYDPVIVGRLIDSLLGGLWLDMTGTATPLTLAQARKLARSQLALLFPRHFTIEGPR
jgi:AcrR family transcriptional regulator